MNADVLTTSGAVQRELQRGDPAKPKPTLFEATVIRPRAHQRLTRFLGSDIQTGAGLTGKLHDITFLFFFTAGFEPGFSVCGPR